MVINDRPISSTFCNHLCDHLSGVFYKCLNDENKTIVYISEKLEQLLGFKTEELINNQFVSFGSLIHVKDRYKWFQAFHKGPNNSSFMKYRLVHRNGTEKRVKDILHGVYDKTGNLIYIEGYIEELTSLRDNVDMGPELLSLQNITNRPPIISTPNLDGKIIHEEQLKKIFDRVNEVIYTVSKEGKFLTLNYAFEKITGWETKKWIGKSFLDLVHPENITMTIANFRKIFNGESVDAFELRIKTKAGKYIYTELTPSALIENGIIVSSLGTAKDISFRKETEIKMKLIYETISVKTGMNYFSNLAKYCCESLNVQYTYIGLHLPHQQSVQTLAFSKKNHLLENFTYSIAGTPAQKIIKMERFAYLENVQAKFPEDKKLKTLGIESYIGFPLFNEDYDVLGIIVLMDNKPMTDAKEKESILSFVLSRTANEISRNSAERKLKESEEFNKGVLSSLASHIAVLNKNGHILSVNNAWINFYKNNGETVLGRRGIGTNYFEDCEKAYGDGNEIAKQALTGIKSVLNKKIKNFQLEYSLKLNGQELWFILSASIYESTDPKVVIRHTDITERIKIENQLKKSEKNYRDLIENSQDIVFSVTKTSKFIFTNNFCQNILKYSTEELNALKLIDIIHPKHKKECLMRLKNVMRGKQNTSIESVFVTKQKKIIFVEGNMTPLVIGDEVVGIQCFFKDISERKKAEEQLIKSEQRYKNVVENINDAIIVRNLKGRITYSNQRFLDLLGFEKDDLLGLSMEDYIAPGWQAEIRKQYSKIINNTEIPEVYEYQGLHNDGTTRWLEDKITLLYENNKIIGTQAVIRDVTEIKRKENDLKKLINELTNRNNEMMQFNYIVSHNLRAPIANIIGLSNLINTDNMAQKDGKVILEHIKDSSVKMDEMIKDLSIVLNTRSNLNAKKEKTYFHHTIQSVSKILQEQIALSKCRLTVNINPLANEMFTIKSYIESILFNLISNAIKYRSPKRSLSITINIQKENEKTLVTIGDNGAGINLAENGAYIFGLYKRFNYDVEGKGLGLHMTKAQVEALGGTIKVESEINKGTVFKIEFQN